MDAWQALSTAVDSFGLRLRKSTAVNVSSAADRTEAKDLVQAYFRTVRPELTDLSCDVSSIDAMDGAMQELLRLSNGTNRRTSYRTVHGRIKKARDDLEVQREISLGQRQHRPAQLEPIEKLILETLRGLVPSAALSYEQALRDLSGPDRLSYRGTANELREGLRETIDHLAPDTDVASAAGYRPERGRTSPTHRQKVRYILKSRSVPRTAAKAPEEAVVLVEELTARLARASYERTSLSAHIATAKREVRQLKMYTDSVLAELLEIHR
jgi:hypothetical protein